MIPIEEDDVIKILKILDESNYEELDLEMGDFKLSVRKSGSANSQPIQDTAVASTQTKTSLQKKTVPAIEETSVKTQTISQPKDHLSASDPGGSGLQENEGLIPVKSPLMGLFYRRPKPEAPPFVEVGSRVRKEDAVCLIEVMKTFTSVAAGVDGVIAKICVEAAQLVEYQQTIFLIKPDSDSETGAGQ